MAICSHTHGQLEYLAAEGLCVPHCFTTRSGGVSTGHLASLNLGFHRGDAPGNVEENFRRVAGLLGVPLEQLVLTRQVHSDTVRPVGREAWGELWSPDRPECDALVTNVPGTALAVFTADCTPILLHDPVTGAVGAIHAGWRGTAASIAAKTVSAMSRLYGTDPADLRAAIGPNIGPCCFETDADVPQAMVEAYGPQAREQIRAAGDKYYVNLKALNALSLSSAGVRRIEISGECTVCSSQRFWSHRATRGLRGSQGAMILCKEAE